MIREQETITVDLLRSELKTFADELKGDLYTMLKKEISSDLSFEFDSLARRSSGNEGTLLHGQHERPSANRTSRDSLESGEMCAYPSISWIALHGNSYSRVPQRKDDQSSSCDVPERKEAGGNNTDGTRDAHESHGNRRGSVGGFEKKFARYNTEKAEEVLASSSSDSEDDMFLSSKPLVQRLFASCMHNDFRESVACLAVALNAICIGVETQYMAIKWSEKPPECFNVVETCFCVFFAVEIVFRFCSEGVVSFFCSAQGGGRSGWRWNMFDLCVTILQAVAFLGPWRLQELPCLRLLRLARVFRLLRSIKELRMLIVSIKQAFRSLLWAMVLLLTIIYLFAVFLTSVVTDFKIRRSARENDELEEGKSESFERMLEWFGTLDKSMLSLYAIVSEGVHWDELMEPLAKFISPWMRLAFFVFSGIAIFAVMNVVTAVFVESVIERAADHKKHSISKRMRKVFRTVDDDNSGEITWEEFDRQVDCAEIQAALRAIDVDARDARDVFRLLDIDGSGTLDLSELVDGSYRLLGQAKAVDLAIMFHEFKRFATFHRKHAQHMEKRLSALVPSSDLNLKKASPRSWGSSDAQRIHRI